MCHVHNEAHQAGSDVDNGKAANSPEGAGGPPPLRKRTRGHSASAGPGSAGPEREGRGRDSQTPTQGQARGWPRGAAVTANSMTREDQKAGSLRSVLWGG